MKRITDQFKGSYIKTVEDPIRTHALIGIGADYDSITRAEKALREVGADKIKVAKTKNGFAIVFFRLNNIQ